MTLSFLQWVSLLGCAFLIGMSKAGIKGLGMVIVSIMALQFGAKASTGLVVPMLSMADLMAVRYYRRDADWRYVGRLLPAAAVGVILGVWIGNSIDDNTFRTIMAWIIILGLILIVWQERRPIEEHIIQHPVTSSLAGLAGGFTTMVGNAAGPVMSVYLLATRLPKNEFIGTAAWFFLIMNLFKMPFHIWVWETLSWSTFKINLMALPLIVIGFGLGILIVRRIPQQAFRYFIIGITALTAIRMLF